MIHKCYMYDTYMINIWYVYSTYMIHRHIWCRYIYDTCMMQIHIWYMYDTYMIHIWYTYITYDTHMIHIWYMLSSSVRASLLQHIQLPRQGLSRNHGGSLVSSPRTSLLKRLTHHKKTKLFRVDSTRLDCNTSTFSKGLQPQLRTNHVCFRNPSHSSSSILHLLFFPMFQLMVLINVSTYSPYSSCWHIIHIISMGQLIDY